MDERYIKLSDAKNAIADYIAEQTVSKYGSLESCMDAKFAATGAMNELDYVPAADVVPKSEVEMLEEKCAILNEKNAQLALALFRDFPTTKELEVWEACEAVKTKVAREIFEEIDRLMLDGVIDGKYPIKVINPDKYAELKKKYTE